MCGIIGVTVSEKEGIKDAINQVFTQQKNRGIRGFGVGIRKLDGSLIRERTTTEEEIFNSDIWSKIEVGDQVLFHHRQPTSTPNLAVCNHPIANEDESMLLVHNGIISQSKNVEEFIDKSSNRHSFETALITQYRTAKGEVLRETTEFTDTEIAVHSYEDYLEFGFDYIGSMRYLGQEGSSAFLILHKEFDGILFVAHSYPLWGFKYKENYFLASEKPSQAKGVDLRDKYGFLVGNQIHLEEGNFNSATNKSKVITVGEYDDDAYWMGAWNGGAVGAATTKKA